MFDREPEEKAEGVRRRSGCSGGVIGTRHVGASTDQAQATIADETLRIVRGYVPAAGAKLRQHPAPPPQTCGAGRGWWCGTKDKVGVCSPRGAGAIRRHDINVETMQNMIFQGAKAACAMDSPGHLTNASRSPDPQPARWGDPVDVPFARP